MWRPFFISNTKHDHGEILWDNIAPYWPIMEKASNGARHCPSGGNFLMRSNISLNSYVMARHNSNKTKDPLVSRTRDSRKKQGKTMKTKEYHGQPRKGGGVPWTWRRRRWSRSRTGLVVGLWSKALLSLQYQIDDQLKHISVYLKSLSQENFYRKQKTSTYFHVSQQETNIKDTD